MMEVGKLYTCEEYHLMLYPGEDAINEFIAHSASKPEDIAAHSFVASRLEHKTGRPFAFTQPSDPLLVVGSSLWCGMFFEVLAGGRRGWIVERDWFNLREIT